MFKNLALLALMGVAQAHMHLEYPPALKGDNNPNTQGSPDSELNYPYGCCGMKQDMGPCHGHLDLLDTDEGKPVVTWQAGQKVNFTISGQSIENTDENPTGSTHWGGSCQVGFSVDKGKTFKVAATWNGNCPLREGSIDPNSQNFDFTVPENIPSGDAVFAWTWVNRESEFNMNCASVSIQGGSGQSQEPQEPKAPKASPTAPSKPKQTQSSQEGQENTSQYTLSGCTCECPSNSWTEGCQCYDCASPETKRHLVARKAVSLHKRRLESSARNAPIRRAQAFSAGLSMITGIDHCEFPSDPMEAQFETGDGEVHEGDGEYQLQPLASSCHA